MLDEDHRRTTILGRLVSSVKYGLPTSHSLFQESHLDPGQLGQEVRDLPGRNLGDRPWVGDHGQQIWGSRVLGWGLTGLPQDPRTALIHGLF